MIGVVIDDNVIDTRPGRPDPSGGDHRLDRVGLAGKYRFDRAVAPVAHQAGKSARHCLTLCPGTETDSLNAT